MISIVYDFELNPGPEEIREEIILAELPTDMITIAVWHAIGLVLIVPPLVMIALG